MPFNTNLGTGKTLKMYDVRFIGLLWDVDDLPYHRVLRVCSERVVKRGDNHQTLRPDPTIEAEHEAIVGNFLRSFTAPDPQDFERVIQVGVEDDALTILRKAVDPLVDILGLPNPDDGTLQAALDKAGEYKTTTPYHAPARISKTVRYFGLAPEIDLPELVSSLLKRHPDESAQAFLQDLVSKSRIVAKPHVTLSHENNVQAEKNEAADAETPGESQPGPHQRCWDQCQALASEGSSTSAMYQYNITHLVWDDRVMSLVIDTLEPSNPETIQLEVPEDYVKHLHITVGTRTEEIPAFESRGIVGAASEGIAAGRESGEAKEVVEGGGKVRWFSIEGIKGEGRVKGMW
jgi:tRNA ligase